MQALYTTGGNAVPNKVDILGVNVDSLTMQEAVEQVEKYIEERNPVLIATANAEMLMRANAGHL